MQKVMLIEDDAIMLSLLRTYLGLEGFNVVPLAKESTVDEIMRTIRQEKPALALLDVHLFRIDGFDLLRSIREDDNLKTTRVIMSSGMDFRSKSLAHGADGFILKPYMPDELIALIQETIGI